MGSMMRVRAQNLEARLIKAGHYVSANTDGRLDQVLSIKHSWGNFIEAYCNGYDVGGLPHPALAKKTLNEVSHKGDRVVDGVWYGGGAVTLPGSVDMRDLTDTFKFVCLVAEPEFFVDRYYYAILGQKAKEVQAARWGSGGGFYKKAAEGADTEPDPHIPPPTPAKVAYRPRG